MVVGGVSVITFPVHLVALLRKTCIHTDNNISTRVKQSQYTKHHQDNLYSHEVIIVVLQSTKTCRAVLSKIFTWPCLNIF
jgi:hypothetical protein